jgi:internalin A
LYLGNNRTDSLPSNIEKLKNLKALGIGYNFIDELPEAVCSLSMLKILNIGNNNITKLPNNFLKCMQNAKLYIVKNSFELNKSERAWVKEKYIEYTEFQENNFHEFFIKYAIQGKKDKAKQLFDKIAKLDSLPSTDKSVLAFALMSLDMERESAAVLHQDSVMVLDLEDYGLTDLSEKIDRFKNLKAIHLQDNYLHSLSNST